MTGVADAMEPSHEALEYVVDSTGSGLVLERSHPEIPLTPVERAFLADAARLLPRDDRGRFVLSPTLAERLELEPGDSVSLLCVYLPAMAAEFDEVAGALEELVSRLDD